MPPQSSWIGTSRSAERVTRSISGLRRRAGEGARDEKPMTNPSLGREAATLEGLLPRAPEETRLVTNSRGVTISGDEAAMEVPTTMDTKLADQDEMLALEATDERSGCKHHWVIDSPAGPVSKGACRSCGQERDFPNYIEGRFNNPRRNP